MNRQQKEIPIIVLTGFLGAGKTTLLNYILNHSGDRKFGAIVNDFGDINIDSRLIEKQTDQKLELSNGCICCSLDNMDLAEAIDQFAHPSAPVDTVLIEASGLAQPRELLFGLRDSMSERVYLDSIICMIDGEHFLTLEAAEYKLVREQIKYADFVLINKKDLIDVSDVDKIEKAILEVNSRARIFLTSRGEIDFEIFLNDNVSHLIDNIDDKGDANHDHHLHNHYGYVSFSTTRPLQPLLFQEFVNKKIPRQIFRAKGIVNLGSKGHGRKYIFNLVGSRADLTWEDWGEEKPRTEVVFIGQGFNRQELKRELQACIDKDPDGELEGLTVRLPRKNG